MTRRVVTAVSGLVVVGALTAACTGASSAGSPSASTVPSASPSTDASTSTTSTSTSGSTSGSSRPSQGHGSSSSTPSGHPSSGQKLSTVPTSAVVTRPAVPLRSSAPFGNGVYARIVSVSHGTVKGQGPGVIAGQAEVVFSLRMTNKSSRAIRLDTVQVTATYGSAATPATASDEQSHPFSGRLPAGASAAGKYAFAVPRSDQGQVAVAVSYAQGVPVVVLHGSAH
ncbi:hypothetical protein [Jatrophihabitans endophyticus]|uniref:hypothetical protein n=1 Tax=Jatrophihabitans endophyticus TaxID=1206085 RepID=UPI0019F40916|nr:hypothetical protein [Jatrophihabitans endophyticus]MBE7189881.1 hypothetical protein [Jatrophihabitans endophyticus]